MDGEMMKKTEEQKLITHLSGILIAHVEPIFKENAKVTLIVRFPDNNKADILVTSDSFNGIIDLMKRSKI